MCHLLPLLLFFVIRGSLGIEDVTFFDLGDDSVAMTGPTDLVSGLWDSSIGAEMTLDNNSLFSQFGEDESNQNLLFAADPCPSTDAYGFKTITDGLEARDDSNSPTCSPSNGPMMLKIPEIPTTLNELTDKLSPFGSSNKKAGDDPVVQLFLNSGVELMNRRRCPKNRWYHLCCNCDPKWGLALCTDCVPSELLSPPIFLFIVLLYLPIRYKRVKRGFRQKKKALKDPTKYIDRVYTSRC